MAHIHRFGNKKTGPGGQGLHSHELPGGQVTGTIDGTDTDNHTHVLPDGSRTGGPIPTDNFKGMAQEIENQKNKK